MPLSATYKKLRNGKWTLSVVNDGSGHVRPGQRVSVTTAAGNTTTELIGDILASDGQYTLCTIMTVGMSAAPRDHPRSQAGAAGRYDGYLDYMKAQDDDPQEREP